MLYTRVFFSIIFLYFMKKYKKHIRIIIFHGFGYSTVYAHLSRMYVNVGDEVTKDDVIGTMGNSGRTTGPHLHYEVLVDGIPENPVDFLP